MQCVRRGRRFDEVKTLSIREQVSWAAWVDEEVDVTRMQDRAGGSGSPSGEKRCGLHTLWVSWYSSMYAAKVGKMERDCPESRGGSLL